MNAREAEEFLKPHVSGFSPSGAIHQSPPAPERSTFLLDPGGQDYVGNNSYDDTSQEEGEKSHHDQSR
jgi:hypothetical protein